MASTSRIEWTDVTWNPVTGCTKVSAGCKFCYAEVMAKRLHAMGQPRYRNNFKLTLHEDLIDLPKKWRKPRRVFVNSMSDLFHQDVPLSFIERVFETMAACPSHVFQVLTKRSDRLVEVCDRLCWPENVWMGVSIEDQRVTQRARDLQKVPAAIRFLSLEPLLGPLPSLDLDGIQWVIVGGESGRSPRPMCESWVHDIRDQCLESNVAFFFKQWGGTNKKKAGRILEGRAWDEMPSMERFRGDLSWAS